MNHKTVRKLLSLFIITVTFSTGTAYSAECEISGVNLLQAYSRAKNNNFKMMCWSGSSVLNKDANFIMMPTPNGLTCKHSKHIDPYQLPTSFIAKFFIGSNNKLRNGWKLSRASSVGGATKAFFDGGVWLKHTTQHHSNSFSFTLKKIWIKKTGARCNDIQAVIRDAFGD